MGAEVTSQLTISSQSLLLASLTIWYLAFGNYQTPLLGM